MFVEAEMTWTVLVQPNDMKTAAHTRRAMLWKLLKDFSNVKCTEELGFHLAVTTIEEIGEGTIWDGKGCAGYKVRFRCLLFKPIKDEKLFAVVQEVTVKGLMCTFGPVEKLFIPRTFMNGFEFQLGETTGPCYKHHQDGSLIDKDVVIRCKLVATKWDELQRQFSTIGTINGDYLGVDHSFKSE